ncbi:MULTISPECIES: septation protein SepH [Pseudonocardia]|uniref:septation protein SepH n=1 Tax=Pseudonocardia TaxID=1847 RepID=UPI001FCA57ED|nr:MULTISPECIES: septation protein SepH [Pseudonocardia]
MRALRVVGVTGDGSVVLEDPGRRERYTVPADEQLRAAARGDVTRLGQIAIELESQLRPREIQARIRGGASVDEVAAAAGVPTQKIERFAYPVLLERSRTAELAQGAHPQRADGPDSRTLGETVAHTFGLRGQDYGGAGWDSWKGEDGKWVVVLTWQTGRSDNAAHWAFQPGAHGGTVVALDEHASDLVEGLPARPLRPLGAVVDMARDEDHTSQAPTTAAPARAVAAAGGQQPEAWAGRGIAPEQRRASPPPPRTRVETPGRTVGARPDDTRAPAAAAPVVPQRAEQVEDAGSSAAADTSQADSATTDGTVASTATADAPGADTTAAAGTGTGTTGAAPNGSASTGTSPDDVSSNGASSNVSATAAAAPVGAAPTGRDSTASDTADADPATPVSAGTGSAAPHGTGTDAAATDAVAPAATDAGDTTASGAETSATDSGSAGDAAGPAASSATTSPEAATATPASDAAAPTTTNPGSTTAAPAQDTGTAASTTVAPTTPAPTTPASAGTAAGSTSTSADHGEASPAASGDAPDEGTDAPTGTAAAATGAPGTSPSNGSEQETDPSPAQDTESAAPRRPSTAGSRRTKKGKPVMPSWDEVLLGVRGQR